MAHGAVRCIWVRRGGGFAPPGQTSWTRYLRHIYVRPARDLVAVAGAVTVAAAAAAAVATVAKKASAAAGSPCKTPSFNKSSTSLRNPRFYWIQWASTGVSVVPMKHAYPETSQMMGNFRTTTVRPKGILPDGAPPDSALPLLEVAHALRAGGRACNWTALESW